MHCKLLWIKASAKSINVNAMLVVVAFTKLCIVIFLFYQFKISRTFVFFNENLWPVLVMRKLQNIINAACNDESYENNCF